MRISMLCWSSFDCQILTEFSKIVECFAKLIDNIQTFSEKLLKFQIFSEIVSGQSGIGPQLGRFFFLFCFVGSFGNLTKYTKLN